VSGAWSPHTSSLHFTITPRFYQHWWFYLIVLAVLAGLIYLVTNIRYKRLILKQEKLEAVILEQTREIRKEKEEIQAPKGDRAQKVNQAQKVTLEKEGFPESEGFLGGKVKSETGAQQGQRETLESRDKQVLLVLPIWDFSEGLSHQRQRMDKRAKSISNKLGP
jgi:hypothetical protein